MRLIRYLKRLRLLLIKKQMIKFGRWLSWQNDIYTIEQNFDKWLKLQ